MANEYEEWIEDLKNAPATKMSTGWISPFCDKCAEGFNDKFEPIEN